MTSRPGERQSRFHVRLSVSTRLRPVGGAAKASLGPFVMCGEREKKSKAVVTWDQWVSPWSLRLTQGCILIIAVCDSHTASLRANAS